MKLTIVLVHYFTPDLLRSCVGSILATTGSFPGRVEIAIVDNGSAESDRGMIDGLPATVIRPGENLGYAAAINKAVAACPADVHVFMNPDIEVSDGCLRRLAEVARETGGAAGPKFYLDRQKRFLLPPAEDRRFGIELLRVLAPRSPFVARLARMKWRRHARLHWNAVGPIASHHLSGAMLAVSAEAWARVGPFDEAYKLYYEETDWLRRAAALGVPTTYVADAVATHFYNKSAGKEPRAEVWFRQSERRFRRKHYGKAAAALLKLLGRGLKQRSEPAAEIGLQQLVDAAPGAAAWIEIALSPTGFPATACRMGGDIADALAGAQRVLLATGKGRYSVRLVDEGGTETLHRHVLVESRRLPRRQTKQPRTALNTDDYRIRTYRPGDEVEINRLFNEVFGLNRTIGQWQKKFLAFGQEPRIVLIVDRADRIATHYSACEVPFEIDGKSVTVCQIVDVFSVRRETAVGRQFFVKAANAFIDLYCGQKGVSATYGFPGPRAYRLGQHTWNYRAFAPVTVWKASLATGFQPSPMAGASPDRAGLEGEGAALDRLWEKARRLYPAGARRDLSWVSERYFKRDAGKYRSVFVRDGNELSAWAIFAVGGGHASIADIVWDGSDTAAMRALLAGVRREASELGAGAIEMWGPDHGPPASVLRADGWIPGDHPGGAFHVVQSFDERVDEVAVRRSMFYSLGDSDLI